MFSFEEDEATTSARPKHQKVLNNSSGSTSKSSASFLLAASKVEAAGTNFMEESKSECIATAAGNSVMLSELNNNESSVSYPSDMATNAKANVESAVSLNESIYYVMQSAPLDVITTPATQQQQQSSSIEMNGVLNKMIKLSPGSSPSSTSLNGVKISYSVPQANSARGQQQQHMSFPIIPSSANSSNLGSFSNATTTVTLTSPMSAESPGGSIVGGLSTTRVVRDERRRANHNEGKLHKQVSNVKGIKFCKKFKSSQANSEIFQSFFNFNFKSGKATSRQHQQVDSGVVQGDTRLLERPVQARTSKHMQKKNSVQRERELLTSPSYLRLPPLLMQGILLKEQGRHSREDGALFVRHEEHESNAE
jgi:hypothetical protein